MLLSGKMMRAENTSAAKAGGVLMVTLPADSDNETWLALQKQVWLAMARYRVGGLIMDASALATLNPLFTWMVGTAARKVALTGGRTVVAGMPASVSVKATQLGLTWANVLIAPDVDRALAALQAGDREGKGNEASE